jgi:hypothetical protein
MKTLTTMVRVMMDLLPNAKTHHLSIMWTIPTFLTLSITTTCIYSPTSSKPRKCSKCSTCAQQSSLTRRSTSSNSHSSPPQATLTLLSARIIRRWRGYIRWRTGSSRIVAREGRMSSTSGRMQSIDTSRRQGPKLELVPHHSRKKWRLCKSCRAWSCMNKFTTKHKYYPRTIIWLSYFLRWRVIHAAFRTQRIAHIASR